MPLVRTLAGLLLGLGCLAAQAASEPIFGLPLLQLDGLEEPSGACFDGQGRLHVVESRAHRVSRWSASGEKLGEWGADGRLSWPRDLACVEDGLIVLDSGHGRLLWTDLEGNVRAAFGEPGHGPGQFHDARAIDVAGDELVVADTGNDRLQLLSLQRDDEGLPVGIEARLRLGPFSQPAGVALLPDGSIVLADTRADRLLRLDATDFSPKAWGARGEAPGLFSRPRDLVASEGRLYAVDSENHRVQVFSEEGESLGAWGRHAWLPHEGEGRLHYPELLAVDAARGRAVVCEPFEDRCQLFGRGPQPPDPARDRITRRVDRSSHYGRRLHAEGRLIALTEMDGTSVSLMDLPRELPILIHRLGRPGRGHGLFTDVVDAIIDGPHRVHVADAGARRIATFEHEHDPDAPSRFDPRLARLVREIDLAKVDLEPKLRPVALARGGGDELFVLDAAGSRVVMLSRDARVLRAFGRFGSGEGELRFPAELAFDPAADELLVVDTGNARIEVFDGQGNWKRSLGSEAQLVEPQGLALAPEGRLFVSDRGTNRVLRFAADGRLELSWGDENPGSPAAERMAAGQLHRPTGLALMADGRLLVIDHGHHRGQIFTTEGEFVKAFGARLFTRPTRGPRSGDEKD